MKLNYTSEIYQIWTEIDSVSFERKLENETAFDGIVKIYSLKTNVENVNQKLEGHFFGNFIYSTENGAFLRMFDNKDSWPKTTLIYLDFINSTVTEINRNNSSWNVWKGKNLENGKYSIEISPTESIEFQT
ncbi:hypothetical protein [Flavobacterium taihuense]|uniref:Uncharacterized protein n=1 Tax=Flavobacterium taihuense TaxID=2857508 RepID=A0ABS6Y1E2_9FLAO|nr:hypothetical protein [Flavobacterium taihuense]MBW4362754.1 hypothetical protein [Flavobacterium taihuense]MBW4362756.1 hypothetical protein [Flavobacterium taihuense]